MAATRASARRASGSDASESEWMLDPGQLGDWHNLSDASMHSWLGLVALSESVHVQLQVLAVQQQGEGLPHGSIQCKARNAKSASVTCSKDWDGVGAVQKHRKPGALEPVINMSGRQWQCVLNTSTKISAPPASGKKRAIARSEAKSDDSFDVCDSDVSAKNDGPTSKQGLSSADTDASSVCSLDTGMDTSDSNVESRLPKAVAARKKQDSMPAPAVVRMSGKAFTQEIPGLSGRRCLMLRSPQGDESLGVSYTEIVMLGSAQTIEGLKDGDQQIEIITNRDRSKLPTNFPTKASAHLMRNVIISQLKDGDLSGETLEGISRSGWRARFTVGQQVADVEYECDILYLEGDGVDEIERCQMYSTFELETIKVRYMEELRELDLSEEEMEVDDGVEFTGDISTLSWDSLRSSPPPKAEPKKRETKSKSKTSPAKAQPAKAQPKKKPTSELFEGLHDQFKTPEGRRLLIDTASRIVSVKARTEALCQQRKSLGLMSDEICEMLKLFVPGNGQRRLDLKQDLCDIGACLDSIGLALANQSSVPRCQLAGCDQPCHSNDKGGFHPFCRKGHADEQTRMLESARLARVKDAEARAKRATDGPQATNVKDVATWGPGPTSPKVLQGAPPKTDSGAAPPDSKLGGVLDRYPLVELLTNKVAIETITNIELLGMLVQDMCDTLSELLPRHIRVSAHASRFLEFLEITLAEFESEGIDVDQPEGNGGWTAVCITVCKWAKEVKRRRAARSEPKNPSASAGLNLSADSGDRFAKVMASTMAATVQSSGMQLAGLMGSGRTDGKSAASAEDNEEKNCALRSLNMMLNADANLVGVTTEAAATMAILSQLDASRAASLRNPDDAAASMKTLADCAQLGSALICNDPDAERVFTFDAANQLGITSGSPMSLAKSTKDTATQALARLAAELLHTQSAVPREGQGDMESFMLALKKMLKHELDSMNEKEWQGVGHEKELFGNLASNPATPNRRQLSNEEWLASAESSTYASALSLAALLEKAQALMQPFSGGTLWGACTELLAWGRRMRVAPSQIGAYFQDVFKLFARERKQFKTGFNPIRPSAARSWYDAACRNTILKEKMEMIKGANQLSRCADVTFEINKTPAPASLAAITHTQQLNANASQPYEPQTAEPKWLNPANGEVVADKAAAQALSLWPPSKAARKAAKAAGKAVYCTPLNANAQRTAPSDARIGQVGQPKQAAAQPTDVSTKAPRATRAGGKAKAINPHIAANPNAVASIEITSAWSAKNMTFEEVPRKKCWWYWVKGECSKGTACAFVHG